MFARKFSMVNRLRLALKTKQNKGANDRQTIRCRNVQNYILM